MSSYPIPTAFPQTIFNPANWSSFSDFLTMYQANKKYLIKTGADTDFGNLTLKQNLYFSDSNLAIYRAGANDLRISVSGVDRIQQTASATSINQPLLLSSGSSTNPSYSFQGDTSSGWYRNGAGDIRLSIFGLDSLTYSGGQFLVNGRERTTIAGTAANPSIKIGTDDTLMTGFYNNGIYALTASVGQTAVADFRYTSSSQGIRLYGNTTTIANNGPYSPSVLGYYQEVNYTSTFTPTTGTLTLNPSISFQLTRIGNIVTLTFQGMTSAVKCNTTCYYDSTQIFPTQFQQKSGQSTYFYITATFSGAVTQIILQVDTRFRLVSTSGGGLPANIDIAVSGFSVSWSILV